MDLGKPPKTEFQPTSDGAALISLLGTIPLSSLSPSYSSANHVAPSREAQ